MEILLNKPEKIAIKMNANDSLANALRRSVNEIPTLAFDEVEIFKNDSALYDEMLAHRVGLVPIKTEKKMGAKTEIEFKLSKKGPGKVYSGDLKGSATLVHDNIPLAVLEKDQEVEIVATARFGKGIDHAKHIPGLCYYRHLIQVKSKNERVERVVQQSKGLVKPEKTKDGWICDIDGASAQEIESLDAEAMSNSNEIILIIESYGSIPASDILINAANALGSNLEELEKAFK